jgi:hypothetical protein
MSVCPVCEAPAQSRVCEVCGHAFAPEANVAQAAASRLPDLDVLERVEEPTPVSPLLDLEPTRFESQPNPAPSQDADWEQTRLGEVPDVAAGGLAELETGREPVSLEKTPPSVASVTCRYCRNVQTAGLMCERCGMRLPWSARVAPATAPTDPDVLVRCPRCGVRTYQRERCASCGGELAGEA